MLYTNPNIKKTFSDLYGQSQSVQEIEKSIFDEIEKGAKAEIGSVRMWGKEQWVKHSDGWVHVRKSGKAILEKPGNVRVDAEKHHIDHFHKHTSSDIKEETAENSKHEKDWTADEHKAEAEKWAGELSNRTEKSKGMTNTDIDEKETHHSRQAKLKGQKDDTQKMTKSQMMNIAGSGIIPNKLKQKKEEKEEGIDEELKSPEHHEKQKLFHYKEMMKHAINGDSEKESYHQKEYEKHFNLGNKAFQKQLEDSGIVYKDRS